MELTTKNSNPFLSVRYVRDLQAYYDYIEIVAEFRMEVGTAVNVDGGKCVCVSSYKTGTVTYSHKFVSDAQMVALSSSCKCAQSSSLTDFVAIAGYKHSLNYRFKSGHYLCGASGLSYFLDNLNDNAVVIDGGAPCFCLTLYGNIVCIDYEYEMRTQKAVVLSADIQSDVTNTEWMNTYPSRLDVVVGDDNGLHTERIEMRKVGITSRAYAMDNTDGEFERLRIKYTNDYNRKLYRSRTVEYHDTSGVSKIGAKVNVGGIEGIVDFTSIDTMQTGNDGMYCRMVCGL